MRDSLTMLSLPHFPRGPLTSQGRKAGGVFLQSCWGELLFLFWKTKNKKQKTMQCVAINCVFRACTKVPVLLEVVRTPFLIHAKHRNRELSTRGQQLAGLAFSTASSRGLGRSGSWGADKS